MSEQEAVERIRELLREGKKLSQIVSEDPTLIVGLDLFHREMIKGHLSANISAVVKRGHRHTVVPPKK